MSCAPEVGQEGSLTLEPKQAAQEGPVQRGQAGEQASGVAVALLAPGSRKTAGIRARTHP